MKILRILKNKKKIKSKRQVLLLQKQANRSPKLFTAQRMRFDYESIVFIFQKQEKEKEAEDENVLDDPFEKKSSQSSEKAPKGKKGKKNNKRKGEENQETEAEKQKTPPKRRK